jgi:hypothetical protein
MTALAPGTLVRRRRFDLVDRRERPCRPTDPIWVIRCAAGREGAHHLITMLERDGQPVRTSSVAGADELELVAAAPTFTPGQHISYEGRHATVLKDYGDGFSRGKLNEDRAQ